MSLHAVLIYIYILARLICPVLTDNDGKGPVCCPVNSGTEESSPADGRAPRFAASTCKDRGTTSANAVDRAG